MAKSAELEQLELPLTCIPEGFKPMLADKLPAGASPMFPCLVSPKLDGVRAVVFGGVVYSRKLKPIPNKFVQQLFGRPELEGFDGELIVGEPVGKSVFRDTTSGVMSRDGEPGVVFHVFDVVGPADGFQKRLRMLESRCKVLPKSMQFHVEIVPHEQVGSLEDLNAREADFLKAGYEGLMVRSPAGPYKFGRSTVREGYLLKVKRFVDAEAVVLGVEELERNENTAEKDALGHTKRSTKKSGKRGAGTLGNILARDLVTGVEFSVGSGFDGATRDDLWARREELVGKTFRYTSFPVGEGEAPRFPVFAGWRDAIDIGEVA